MYVISKSCVYGRDQVCSLAPSGQAGHADGQRQEDIRVIGFLLFSRVPLNQLWTRPSNSGTVTPLWHIVVRSFDGCTALGNVARGPKGVRGADSVAAL